MGFLDTLKSFFKGVPKLGSEEIKQAVKNGATFLDVRNLNELQSEGKFQKAKHIPLPELNSRISECNNFKEPVLVFCKSGIRAEMAAKIIKKKTGKEVYNIGGYQNLKTKM